MKTGKAYGYFAYEGEVSKLIEDLENVRERGYPKTLNFTILEDKVTGFCDSRRARLSPRITKLADSTRVEGSVQSTHLEKLRGIKPVKASKLRYLIMAEQPDAGEERGSGLYGANSMTAGRLAEMLNIIGQESHRGISRNAVFYLDGRGRAQASY